MELIDAKADLYLTVIQEDGIGAKPRHLGECVYAKASHRLYNSTVMVFTKTTAYVDLEDEDGIRRVVRFLLSQRIINEIWGYDQSDGKIFHPGPYILLAPPRSQRLDVKLKDAKARRKRDPEQYKKRVARNNQKRRALIKSKGKLFKPKTMDQSANLGYIRVGTGLIQTKFEDISVAPAPAGVHGTDNLWKS